MHVCTGPEACPSEPTPGIQAVCSSNTKETETNSFGTTKPCCPCLSWRNDQANGEPWHWPPSVGAQQSLIWCLCPHAQNGQGEHNISLQTCSESPETICQFCEMLVVAWALAQRRTGLAVPTCAGDMEEGSTGCTCLRCRASRKANTAISLPMVDGEAVCPCVLHSMGSAAYFSARLAMASITCTAHPAPALTTSASPRAGRLIMQPLTVHSKTMSCPQMVLAGGGRAVYGRNKLFLRQAGTRRDSCPDA